MSTNQTIERPIGADIHPEIPIPHWASDRYVDDDGREVCDEYSVDHGRYSIEFQRMVTLGADRYPEVYADVPREDWPPSIIESTSVTKYHAENISLRWENHWPGEDGKDREYFTVFPADIPAMIEALQLAQRIYQAPAKTVRRSAEVEESLLKREQ